MLTVDGLATGLDTGQIIEGLLEVQKAQVDRFNGRKQEIVDQQTAFRSAEARLLELQSSISSLRRFGDNVFLRKQAVSSDEAVAVSVSNRAIPGIYTLHVDSLAQAHQIASNTFGAEDEQIAQGTFSFHVGNGPSVDIEINEGNNTLDSLAEAINTARHGVSAGVMYDGTSYRLLLTSNETGSENLINISYDPVDTSPVPTFDFQNPVQAASDASIVFGSGSGAIAVTNSTNQVDDVLPGLTMDLLESDPTKPITVTVSRDVEPAREAIQGFVQAYNDVLDFVDEQQQFDPESGTASLLFGNRSLLNIRDTLAREVSSAVPGVKSAMNRLHAMGIRLDARNRLSIRSNVLDDVLNERVEGVSSEDVQKLFGSFGETSTPQIRFMSADSDTQDSPIDAPYQVEVLQAAERARIEASSALPASVTIDGTNDELVIAIDRKESDVMKLTHGSYSRQELADHLEDVINNEDSLLGRHVSVTLQNDQLELLTAGYGLSSELTITSGTSLATLGFAGGETDKGQDVVGRFMVGDDIETATGKGQVLTGNQVNGATNGLQLRVTAGASQILTGLTADVTVSHGIAASLNVTLDSFLELDVGELDQINKGFVERIESIDLSIERLNARFEAEQQSLIRQFAQLETTVSELQATGNALSAQLSGLPSIGI